MEKLTKESDWSRIDGNQLCQLIDFSPSNGSLSYRAAIKFKCKDYPNGAIGYIYHKEDFNNLSAATKMMASNPDSEIVFFWSKKQYKNFIYNFLSTFMPRLWIMLSSINAYEFFTNDDYHPEVTGEARYRATAPIKEWKPSAMK